MNTSLLKSLTLVVAIAGAFTMTGCRDANSKNATAMTTAEQPAAAINAATTPAVTEEAKREAEGGNALY